MLKSTMKSTQKIYRDRCRQKRDAANLCIMCGKEPQKSTSKLGENCHIKTIENRKLLAEKRIRNGKCSQCLTANAIEGFKLCGMCRNRKKQTPGYRASLTYKITEKEFNELHEKASGICMICNKERTLNIDHCHASGNVRGLLCNNCNNGLGRFYDSISILKNAIFYLENNL